MTLSGRGEPAPIFCRCSARKWGRAMARAVKSFTTSRVSRPSAPRIASMEKDQWWFIILMMSSSMALAMAMAAWCTRAAPCAFASAPAR